MPGDCVTRSGYNSLQILCFRFASFEANGDVGWSQLVDLNADELQSYLDGKQAEDMGAGSLNSRIDCWVAFG